MYKVGHSSTMPRSTLVYNGRRNVPARSGIHERTLNQYGAVNEKPCRNEMNVQIPVLSKRNRNRVSPDASKRINMETVSVLMKATKEFLCTPDGRPDKTIEYYRPKRQLPEELISALLQPLFPYVDEKQGFCRLLLILLAFSTSRKKIFLNGTDFSPFDIEGYLTERLLRDVNMGPKILNGFCK